MTSTWFEDHNRRIRAREKFAAAHPRFYQYFIECYERKCWFECTVYPSTDTCPTVGDHGSHDQIGVRATVVYDNSMFKLDLYDIWTQSATDKDKETHYECNPYPLLLWDDNGDINFSVIECGTKYSTPCEYFPWKAFFDNCEIEHNSMFEKHQSEKESGEKIYSEISKLVKSTTRRYGEKLTEKQLLTKISEIIAEVTKNDEVRCSFQDDTDYGFSSDDNDDFRR